MHPSSMENMFRCINWYAPRHFLRVVDLGSAIVNGSYRELFDGPTEYIGLDLEPGPGVDVVQETPYQLPLDDASIDLVISGQMLEHCPNFWLVFGEIYRVLNDEGLAFVIAPSGGPIHRYPVDCYRFYPDAYQALADWSGLRLIDCWMDQRGPWNDLVGVFQKNGNIEKASAPPTSLPFSTSSIPNEDPAAELQGGQTPYLDVLSRIHALLQPKLYLEIGVREGKSFALSSCRSIGVDPNPEIKTLSANASVFECTSDDFFYFYGHSVIDEPVDLVFIDGCHLAEYTYRDFINIEKYISTKGVIVIDDVFPNHPMQAARTRQTQIWTGDVWRFTSLLSKARPDLNLTWLDTAPTGLLIVSRLNPENKSLWEQYNPTIREILESPLLPPPESVLKRYAAVPPSDDNLRAALDLS